MTVTKLNNFIIDEQYKKLMFAKSGINKKDNIDDIIIANMCNNVLLNDIMFDEMVINKINNIIDIIYGRGNQ